MRILAFSDLHEEEAALESLRSLAKEHDHVFICGDMARSGGFAKEVLSSFPNAFIIPGNWDSELTNELFSSSPQWLHGRRKELGGLNVVGFGYSNITPFGTYGELTEEDMHAGLSKLQVDRDTLLMLHCPPKGHFDMTFRGTHAGCEAILSLIEEKEPLAAFFGHVHEHEGLGRLGKTTLIKLPAANAMRACSMIIENKSIKAEFISL